MIDFEKFFKRSKAFGRWNKLKKKERITQNKIKS